MKVVFRADASADIGTGHVMRCLALAEGLRQGGHQSSFICRSHEGHPGQLIADMGFHVELLPPATAGSVGRSPETVVHHRNWLGVPWSVDAEETERLLRDQEVDWLVVDHYALDADWEDQLANAADRLMAIDDLADRTHNVDLLLDQNLGRAESDYHGLLPPACKKLIGPDYALLRPEFAEFRKASLARRTSPGLGRILVSMGGADMPNATSSVLDALERSALPSTTVVDVIMGAAAPWLSQVSSRARNSRFDVGVSTNVSNMAERMSQADISIGAAGSTSWERCAMGLPSIVVSLADNQAPILSALSEAGAATRVGFPFQESELSSLVDDFYDNPGKLAAMSVKAAEVCDGSGVDRVIGCLDD
jgi:UDP-2,4-diacetamido-2,4,6-trideoxy-beta-L-altropyranose hydrolase